MVKKEITQTWINKLHIIWKNILLFLRQKIHFIISSSSLHTISFGDISLKNPFLLLFHLVNSPKLKKKKKFLFSTNKCYFNNSLMSRKRENYQSNFCGFCRGRMSLLKTHILIPDTCLLTGIRARGGEEDYLSDVRASSQTRGLISLSTTYSKVKRSQNFTSLVLKLLQKLNSYFIRNLMTRKGIFL